MIFDFKSFDWKTWLLKFSFGSSKRILFYDAMHDAIESKISTFDVLEKMKEIATEHLMGKDAVKIYDDILLTMKIGEDKGNALAVGIAKWVPTQESVMLVGAAGAGSAVLCQAFKELASLLRRQVDARWKMLKSVFMGVVLMLAMIAMTYAIISMLVPQFSALSAQYPQIATAAPFAIHYFAFGQWLLANGIYVLGAILLLVGTTLMSLPLWTGPVRTFFDKYIPPYTIYRRSIATYLLSTIAALVASGVVLDQILSDMNAYGSRYLKSYTGRMLDALKSGTSAQETIALGPLPRNTSEQLRIYQLMPDFAPMMVKLADSNFKQFEMALVVFGALINFLGLVMLGGMAAATIYAIFDFSDAVRGAV